MVAPQAIGIRVLTDEEILEYLNQAILNYDTEAARKAAKRVLDERVDPIVAIECAAKAIRKVGEKFEKSEVFLPHLVMAGDAMTEAVTILKRAVPKERARTTKTGTFVLGTVEGDLHDIGKNIVGPMLTAAGFEVHDIGKDVPAERFIEKAQELDADIIGASALMTTTIPAQKELIEDLKRLGLRDRFKVMVGGGSVFPEWAREIGADGYGKDAPEAAKVAEKLLGRPRI